MSKYRTIVADPPWPQKGAGPLRGRMGFGDALCGPSKVMPYPTMAVDQIKALQVPAERDAHLYLWATNGFLPDAFDVMRAWGFSYSTTIVWAKRPMGGGLGGAYGLATEFVLFGRRGKLPARGRVGRNHFDWKRPYDERGKPKHSAKPAAFFALVESVSPGPYLELFARDKRLGWDSWGDEVPSDIELPHQRLPSAQTGVQGVSLPTGESDGRAAIENCGGAERKLALPAGPRYGLTHS